MKRKKMMALLTAALLSLALPACGSQGGDVQPQDTAEQAEDEGAKEAADAGEKDGEQKEEARAGSEEKEKEEADSADSNEAKMAGDWVMVREVYYSIEPEKKEDSGEKTEENSEETAQEGTEENAENQPEEPEKSTFMTEDNGTECSMSIYKENDGYYMDYECSMFESYEEVNHFPLTVQKGKLYDECSNREWFATAKSTRSEKKYDFTLTGENELERYESTTYEYEDGAYTYISIYTFLRKGSEELENADALRYNSTVTVSNAEELLDAIGNNTKVILKAGEYDLSALSGKEGVGNVYLTKDRIDGENAVVEVQIRDVSNLALEAEEGAEVELYIRDPYYPVLGFYNSSHISLQGLTCGHKVEPGTCSGSVIYTDGCDGLSVKNCELYGSGTYGLECNNSYNLVVNDSEIYDCTYGCTSLYQVSNAAFTNCRIHDNSDLSVVSLSSAYGVSFVGCEFYKNYVSSQYGDAYFASLYDGSELVFNRCTFRDNIYTEFANAEVTTDDCRFY